MHPRPSSLKDEQTSEGYFENELNSLGIEPKKRNELNDREELEELTDNIKQTLYQEYKTAYGNDDKEEDNEEYRADDHDLTISSS